MILLGMRIFIDTSEKLGKKLLMTHKNPFSWVFKNKKNYSGWPKKYIAAYISPFLARNKFQNVQLKQIKSKIWALNKIWLASEPWPTLKRDIFTSSICPKFGHRTRSKVHTFNFQVKIWISQNLSMNCQFLNCFSFRVGISYFLACIII